MKNAFVGISLLLLSSCVTTTLTPEGAKVRVFVRNLERADALARDMGVKIKTLEEMRPASFDIVVNCTPVGMRGPDENETLFASDALRKVKLVYDLVYNPDETRLLHEAKQAGADSLGGFEMLMAQAELQFEIWTGQKPPAAEMRDAARQKDR